MKPVNIILLLYTEPQRSRNLISYALAFALRRLLQHWFCSFINWDGMHRNCTSQIGWTGVSGVGVRVFFVFMYIIYIYCVVITGSKCRMFQVDI